MPTYQYRCRDCGEDLEVVQSFTDDPLTKCPNCKKKALRKVFAAPGISFKGSGFYKNDSRSGSKSAAGSSTNGSSSEKSDTSSDTKSDTKTEPKSDTKKAEPKGAKAPAKASSAKD
jgi:putative FmdB family regulatory protein